MGNTQRLSNHSTIIGWGIRTGDSRAITEVKDDGTIAFELSLPDNISNYRAFRFNWKTNLFVTNPDSIFFESIGVGDSSTININLISNSTNPLNITSFYNTDSTFSVLTTVPFILPALGSVPIEIQFKPFEDGYYKDVLHIRSDTESSRVAQLMILAGRTDSTISSINNQVVVSEYRLEQNFPNPFNPVTTIQYQVPVTEWVILKVYDMLGNEITTLVNEEKPQGQYKIDFGRNLNNQFLSSGIYFYRIQAGDYSNVKKFVLLK
jgi:hypothetical protein